MNKLLKRYISLMLAVLLCLTLLPAAALAEEERSGTEPEPAMEEAAPTAEPGEETGIDEPEPEAELPVETAPTAEAPAPEEEEQSETEQPQETPPAEGETADAPEEAGPAEEIYTEVILETVPLDGGADNDELFAGYVDQVMGISDSPSVYAIKNMGSRLTGVNKAIYDCLVPYIRAIAAGERQSTVMTFSSDGLGLTKTRWTASELGLTSIVGEDGTITKAYQAAQQQMGMNINPLFSALLADFPYEMYWFDKTLGLQECGFSWAYTSSYIQVGEFSIGFTVSPDYSATGETGTLEMNTNVGAAVFRAKDNAASIVSKYKGRTDYQKLAGYLKEICALVEYNYDAASEDYTGGYGNPWQLIWTLDGDPGTNVVCEGYSKAFQYLCDLSSFADACCYTVSGTMLVSGAGGGHMWNIVTMNDGKNYLVDVTNCDNSYAPTERLFLVGGAGTLDAGYGYYNIVPRNGGSEIYYGYNANTRALFSDADLTIAATAYDNASEKPEQYVSGGVIYSLLEGYAAVTGYTAQLPEKVTIPAAIHSCQVYKIEAEAFQNCAGLQSVTIPASVRSLGESAFSGCTGLETLTFEGNLPTVSDSAFTGVTAAAEYYAGKKGFTAEAMTGYGGTVSWRCILAGSAKGTSAYYADGSAWDSGVALSVKPATVGKHDVASILELQKEIDGVMWVPKHTAYDISLQRTENGTTTELQPDGTVTVWLPVPAGYIAERCSVYRLENGKLTAMNPTLADGKLTFTTDHFSLYLVTQLVVDREEGRTLGDVNGDDGVDIMDAMMIAQAVVGIVTISEETDEFTAADYNRNGTVTCLDAVLVAQTVVRG